MNGYEVIEELKGLASSKATGITKELQSAWKEWDLVLNEAPGHGIASKRSAQSSLARMDFRRQPLCVLSVLSLHVESLKSRMQKTCDGIFLCTLKPCPLRISVS